MLHPEHYDSYRGIQSYPDPSVSQNLRSLRFLRAPLLEPVDVLPGSAGSSPSSNSGSCCSLSMSPSAIPVVPRAADTEEEAEEAALCANAARIVSNFWIAFSTVLAALAMPSMKASVVTAPADTPAWGSLERVGVASWQGALHGFSPRTATDEARGTELVDFLSVLDGAGLRPTDLDRE